MEQEVINCGFSNVMQKCIATHCQVLAVIDALEEVSLEFSSNWQVDNTVCQAWEIEVQVVAHLHRINIVALLGEKEHHLTGIKTRW